MERGHYRGVTAFLRMCCHCMRLELLALEAALAPSTLFITDLHAEGKEKARSWRKARDQVRRSMFQGLCLNKPAEPSDLSGRYARWVSAAWMQASCGTTCFLRETRPSTTMVCPSGSS